MRRTTRLAQPRCGRRVPARDVLTERLDDWLPDPQVRTVHRRSARADPEALWRAASELPLREARTLAPLVRWRIPGTPADRTFRGLLASYPFTVLAEDEEERWSLSGMCGRIWTLDRDYPRLEGAEAWRAWSEPGTVKVLFAHWIEGDAIVSGRAAAAGDLAGHRPLGAPHRGRAAAPGGPPGRAGLTSSSPASRLSPRQTTRRPRRTTRRRRAARCCGE
jgi:hypothetical protein